METKAYQVYTYMRPGGSLKTLLVSEEALADPDVCDGAKDWVAHPHDFEIWEHDGAVEIEVPFGVVLPDSLKGN